MMQPLFNYDASLRYVYLCTFWRPAVGRVAQVHHDVDDDGCPVFDRRRRAYVGLSRRVLIRMRCER